MLNQLIDASALPGFEPLKRIGSGSFGDVYLARDEVGELLAVKVLRKDKGPSSEGGAGKAGRDSGESGTRRDSRSSGESGTRRDSRPSGSRSSGAVRRGTHPARSATEREIEGIRQYKARAQGHENLLQIRHVGQTESCWYYSMDAADDVGGGRPVSAENYAPLTLKHVIEQRAPMPADEALSIIADIVRGLEHLHGKGLIHRDVKPANVLFVNGRPKLGDMGLVTPADRDVTQIGTPGYLPPDGSLDEGADLYAAGVMLYEMITGLHRSSYPDLPQRRPRYRREMRQYGRAIQIATRAANWRRNERYQSAASFRLDVTSAREFQKSRRLPNRRALTAIAAVLVVGLIIAAGAEAIRRATAGAIEVRGSDTTSALADVEVLAGGYRGGKVLKLRYEDGSKREIKIGSSPRRAILAAPGDGERLLVVGFSWYGSEPGKLGAIKVSSLTSDELTSFDFETQLWASPPAQWRTMMGRACHVTPLVAEDLDGMAGDEIVVSVKHYDGPCELIVFGAGWSRTMSYWHYGWISEVRAADIDGDGEKELICRALANERRDESGMAREELYRACVFALKPNVVRDRRCNWSMNEWMNRDDACAPSAYGLSRRQSSPGNEAWQGDALDVARGSDECIIRLTFDRVGVALDLRPDMSPIRVQVLDAKKFGSEVPPAVEDFWERVIPAGQ